MVIFYKLQKNCNEIELTKNKMDFNNRKIKIIQLPPLQEANGDTMTHKSTIGAIIKGI